MSAGDLAAVLVGVASLMLVGLGVWVAVALRRATAELRAEVHEMQGELRSVVDDIAASAERTRDDLDRVDGLLDRVEQVTARADGISRVTYRAFAEPVIKTASVVRGTRRAARRLRSPDDPDQQAG